VGDDGLLKKSIPVLLAVDEDELSRQAAYRHLCDRYEPDYEVISAGGAEAGLAILSDLANAGRDVIVILASSCMSAMAAPEFLARARELHPAARCCLLIAWGDQPSSEAMRWAANAGEVDAVLPKPLQPRAEWFHHAIAGYLAEWARAKTGGFEVVKVIGDDLAARSHELRDMLSRNGVPFGFYPVGSDAGRALLRHAGAELAELPVVIVFDGRVLASPSNRTLAEAVGMQTRPRPVLCDVAVIGAGPAGLSAAVYGTSEGIGTAVLESEAVGGQASASSQIRTYLGFPHGVGGAELAHRAFLQASLFGAEFVYGDSAIGLRASGDEYVVALASGGELRARTVVIATGCGYRRLGIPALEELSGRGVFYGSASSEARAMVGREVFVLGGGNSAGQSAVDLADHGARITLLCRESSLAEDMSDYLIKQINRSPAITVRHKAEVVDGAGRGRLESLTLRDCRSGQQETVPAQILFVLIGMEPHTDWLGPNVERDRWGFVMTGKDITSAGWPLDRPPLPFETSLPRVFAIGDVRHGSIKRVAAAVGEGSSVIPLVHDGLRGL
jgi:thioredoxin reductase (NADPH)